MTYKLANPIAPLFVVGIMAGAISLWGQEKASLTQPVFVNTLMPQPAELMTGKGRLAIPTGLNVTVDRFQDERLDDAITRILHQLTEQTGIPSGLPSAPSAEAEPLLVVSVQGPGEEVQSVNEDESYSLEITSRGAHLKAM